MADDLHDCSFADLIQSDNFTFYIGEEKKPFVVHSSAIAATSEPFKALVNGGLAESEKRCAELSDVQPDDFVRFLEYAYRRNYTVPAWELDEGVHTAANDEPCIDRPVVVEEPLHQSPSPPSPPPDRAVPDAPEMILGHDRNGWGAFAAASKKKKLKKRGSLRSKFESRDISAEASPDSKLRVGYQPRTNVRVDQNFSPVFLAHARLYTFADMRLIYPLKALALGKLYETLLGFQLYTERVRDVVELARYAYENGPDRSEAGELNELRQLVVEYLACEADTIGQNKEFRALLEEGGELVGDFWDLVWKHLS